ncbi:DnaJ-domain-containing protein [Trematosphaeria pertusa]|uniref:DnaJ-domain-containing protein n=1 Tax=Trematosphaeria pertusa TaxID=390896 RepID=A0A6A6IVI6_9PLEO|nr:DnaJ-domain-containing protein [Trematosphaeria pertusa]KAF2253630.1 DnaJ-domain-containing protein [Trematosphaeria pertusa]
MDDFMPELHPPETPDYYADLGLQQTATFPEIKRAFYLLAKKHHPDKQGPGVCVDAHEFRKIRAAFEFLRDPSNRCTYDIHYPQLRQAWDQYYAWQEIELRNEERRRAEEIARQRRAAELERARKEEEEQRIAREKAAEEKEARRRAEERLAREKEERERTRKLKEALAEERSQEAARRAREQQENAARERLRREKQREADRKSEDAARRARQEQEAAAEERLKAMVREEKLDAIRENWARMRDAADLRRARPAQPEAHDLRECDHHHIGWTRRKGRVDCVFCRKSCKKFFFKCPQCDISACQACKIGYWGSFCFFPFNEHPDSIYAR